jgi:hypothetical protein
MTLIGLDKLVADSTETCTFLFPALVKRDLLSKDPRKEFTNHMALALGVLPCVTSSFDDSISNWVDLAIEVAACTDVMRETLRVLRI